MDNTVTKYSTPLKLSNTSKKDLKGRKNIHYDLYDIMLLILFCDPPL